MLKNINIFGAKKSGFSLIELCIAIMIFGVVAKALFYSNFLSFEILNSSLKSQKMQSLKLSIDVINAYFRSHIAQSVLVGDDRVFWVSADEYSQNTYSSLVDLSKSDVEKIVTKFNFSNILKAFSQSAGIDFASDFKVAAIFGDVDYKPSDFGYFGDSELALVRAQSDDVLQIKSGYKGQISGAYTLVSNAYALSFDKNSGSIWLYYNWRPWLNESLINSPKALLIDGVSRAEFNLSDAGLDVKICIDDICATELLL